MVLNFWSLELSGSFSYPEGKDGGKHLQVSRRSLFWEDRCHCLQKQLESKKGDPIRPL